MKKRYRHILVLSLAGLFVALGAMLLRGQDDNSNPDLGTVVPVVSIVSGDHQTNSPGQWLDQELQVLVTDSSGNPLNYIPVTFQVIAGDGAISTAWMGDNPTTGSKTIHTDQYGHAGVFLQLGDDGLGVRNSVQASIASGNVTFNCTTDGIIAPISGNNQVGTSGSWLPQPLRARMMDSVGNPMPNWPIYFVMAYENAPGSLAASSGGGSASFVNATTDSDGYAQAYLKLDGFSFDANIVKVMDWGHEGVLMQGYASGNMSKFSGDQQVGAGSTWLSQPLQVLLVDCDGNPVPGLTVFFKPTGGGGAVAGSPSGNGSVWGVNATSDANGIAQVYLRLAGTVFTPNTVNATIISNVSNLPEGPFSVDFKCYMGGIFSIVGGDQQMGFSGSWLPQPLQVRLTDLAGNPATGKTIDFTSVAGGGTLFGTPTGNGSTGVVAVTTDANGIAQVFLKPAGVSGSTNTVNAAVVWNENPGGTSYSVNFHALVSSPDDTNGNGILDAWELAHFGRLYAAGTGANEDPDGDGLTNLQEYHNGTDPNDYYNGQTPAIVPYSGGGQSGPPGYFLPEPWMVRIKDAHGRVLVNAPVTFTMPPGSSAMFSTSDDGQNPLASTITVRTNTRGLAWVFIKL